MSTALATNEKESDVDNIEDPPSNTIASSLKNAYETIVGDCIGQEQGQGQGQVQPSPSSDSDNIHLAPPAKHAAVHPNAPPPPTSNSCSPFFSLTAASDLHITTKQPRLFTDEDTASEAEDQNANDSEESDPFEDLVEQSANQYHQKHHKQEEDDQSEATEKASNLSSSSATTTTTITTTTTPLNIPTPLMEEEEEETSESTAYIAMDEDTFLLFCDDEKDQNEQETQKPGIAILRPITPPLSPLNTSSTSTTTTSNGQADSSGAAWSSGTDSSGLDDSQDTGSLSLPTSATTTPTSTNTNTNTTNAAMIPPNNTTHDEDDESPFDEEEWLQDLANDVDSDEQDPAQTQQQQQQHQRKNPFENIDPDIEESYEVEHVEEEPFEDEPMQDHSNAIPQDNPAVGKESEEDSLGYDIENPKQESDKILQQSPSYDIESMTKSTKSVQEEFEDEPKWDDSYYGSDDDASKWLDDDQHFANTTPSPSENPHIDDEDDFEAHMIQDDEEIIGILPFETNSSHSSSSDDDDGPPIKNVSVKESVDTKRDNGSLSDDGSNRTQAGYGVCFVTYCVLITVVVGLSMIIFFLFDGENKTSKEGLQQSLMYLSSDPTVFDDPQSPQSKALDWLAGPSNENIDLNDKIRRENRYALAVLYFATGGENNLWEFDLGFLSSEHECSWNGFNEVAVQLGVLCEGNKNVVNLRIASNGLLGTLPVETSALSSLTSMDLGDNRLSGTIPSLRFANLNTLNLGTNDFEGPIPYSIASLSNLKHLDLSSNKLSSTLPPSFGQLSVLQKLKLGYNSIYGVFKADFTSFGGGLKELNLTSNSFGGSIEFLQMFPLLEQLDLSSNKFGGTIPMKLGVDLQNLKSIVFSHNQLQGSLPSSLGKLSGLRHLAGSDNKFSGEFPWGSFSDNENSMMLTYISMADNFLSGTLPLDMFRFGALEVIDFQKNQISGSIPIAIGWVSGLKELHLSSNGLTGIVPQSLGRLSSMAILNVAGNMLSSTIPTTLGRLANSLKTLKLHSNDFSGEVPSELGGLDYLEIISLHNNNLMGDIEFFCAMEPRPVISADCGGESPEVICSCCAVCAALDRPDAGELSLPFNL